jgi:hypothetical protein
MFKEFLFFKESFYFLFVKILEMDIQNMKNYGKNF